MYILLWRTADVLKGHGQTQCAQLDAQLRNLLINLKNEGKTIFLNSHLLSEVELISDKVVILHKGKLVREGSVDELTSTKEIYELIFEQDVDTDYLNKLNYISVLEAADKKCLLKLESINTLNKLIDELRKRDIIIQAIIPKKYSLEEMFINVIQDEEKQKL